MAQQIVLPIKDSNVLKMVQDTLLDSFCTSWHFRKEIFSWKFLLPDLIPLATIKLILRLKPWNVCRMKLLGHKSLNWKFRQSLMFQPMSLKMLLPKKSLTMCWALVRLVAGLNSRRSELRLTWMTVGFKIMPGISHLITRFMAMARMPTLPSYQLRPWPKPFGKLVFRQQSPTQQALTSATTFLSGTVYAG